MSKVRNLLKNGAYIGIMNIVSRASGLILNIFLVRMLTTDSFGLFAIFQRIMEKVSSMLRFGGFEISTHVLFADSKDREIKSTSSLLSVPLLLRIIFCLIFAVFFLLFPSYIATDILQQSALIPYMNFFVFACIAGAIEVLCEGVLKGLNLFKTISKINIAYALLILFLMPLFTNYYSLTGAIFAFTICLVLRSCSIITLALIESRRLGYTFSLNNFNSVLIKHIKIGLPSWAPVFIIAPASIYVISLLTSVAGIDDMAYYRVIVTCGVFIQLIPHSLMPAFITESANESDSEESSNFFDFNLKFTILISALVSTLLIGIMPLFISIVFGSAYALAVKFFLIYAFTMIVINCVNLFAGFLVSKKYAYALLFGNTAHGIFLVLVGMYLIPLYGLPGFLVTEFMAYLCSLIIYVIFFSINVKNASAIIYLLIRMLPFVVFLILAILFIDAIQPVVMRFLVSVIGAILISLLFWKTVLSRDEKIQFKDSLSKLPFIKNFILRND